MLDLRHCLRPADKSQQTSLILATLNGSVWLGLRVLAFNQQRTLLR